ncbi:hypothetical protein HNP86_001966 [Methanococcus maripaludis]|uniref:Uncharacterized protein n=1 Tax=Methanococcus maripaludis TaxID=39152 RepID=A0A7J9NWX3_METMI|nr:hypothetical protein [Methanococcus maripaludis]MBA2851807.1 hypothetical protein [Methanococcus maripaludis]
MSRYKFDKQHEKFNLTIQIVAQAMVIVIVNVIYFYNFISLFHFILVVNALMVTCVLSEVLSAKAILRLYNACDMAVDHIEEMKRKRT